jgi:hypothetical protein
MELRIDADHVDFLSEGRLTGRYMYGDEFKPHLHPLNTPRGHTLSLRSPHDHKHHKGLMYALRARDVNFWEERAAGGELVGRQRHERFTSLNEAGETVGLDESLVWLAVDGSMETFAEERSLTCAYRSDRGAYDWRWETSLQAVRDVELVLSEWSVPRWDGTPVNYHGLGIRFRRDFGCTGGNALFLDGKKTAFEEGLGTVAREVEFRGSIDGTWPVETAGLRIRQAQGNALFVLNTPFAFMGLGPTNLAPMRMRAGETLRETYEIAVSDGPTAQGSGKGDPACEPGE